MPCYTSYLNGTIHDLKFQTLGRSMNETNQRWLNGYTVISLMIPLEVITVIMLVLVATSGMVITSTSVLVKNIKYLTASTWITISLLNSF